MTGLEEIGDLGVHGAGVVGLYWAIGPAVRALGRNFGLWMDYQSSNLLKLGEKAQRRLGPAAPQDLNSVHPRIAKEILFEASWISDDVHQEYFAGLLVGSRSKEGRSERGIQYVRLLSGMTSNQIRMHHAIYTAFVQSGSDLDPGEKDRRAEAQIKAPARGFARVITPEQGEDLTDAITDTAIALEQLDLLHPVMIGPPSLLQRGGVLVDSDSAIMEVTSLGLSIYLWAYGIQPWSSEAREQVRLTPLIGPQLEEAAVGNFAPR